MSNCWGLKKNPKEKETYQSLAQILSPAGCGCPLAPETLSSSLTPSPSPSLRPSRSLSLSIRSSSRRTLHPSPLSAPPSPSYAPFVAAVSQSPLLRIWVGDLSNPLNHVFSSEVTIFGSNLIISHCQDVLLVLIYEVDEVLGITYLALGFGLKTA
ncbi:hypothetical protein RIF29_00195 [Crotalaria pallida]|uniref:Uncharacterized protein n=1 Tax=Crotalaria pallida TaxID=3830 RepID=A0AAN9IVW3_CROPI